MSTRYSRRYGATAWLIGAAVLLALALAVTWMLFAGRRPGEERRLSPMPSVTNDLAASSVLPKLMQDVRAVERASSQLVRGVVLLPDGQPAASATVTLYRLLTGWPEWQREHVDQAYTREDGAFSSAALICTVICCASSTLAMLVTKWRFRCMAMRCS